MGLAGGERMELKLGRGKCSNRCLGSEVHEWPSMSWFEKTSSRSVGDHTSSWFDSSESSIDRECEASLLLQVNTWIYPMLMPIFSARGF